MVPIREQLMALVRKLGGTVKNNDNRIPRLLKQASDLTDSESNSGNEELAGNG